MKTIRTTNKKIKSNKFFVNDNYTRLGHEQRD